MESLYQELRKVLSPEEMSHHGSDLYCKITPKSEKLVKQYIFVENVTTFSDSVTHEPWYNIPFAYEPYWTKRGMIRKTSDFKKKEEKIVLKRQFHKLNKTITKIEYNSCIFVIAETKTERLEITVFPFGDTKGIVYSVAPCSTIQETVEKLYAKIMDNFKRRKEFS